MRRVALVLVVAVAALWPAAGAHALPRGTRVEVYTEGHGFMVDMAWVPGTKRIFLTEKIGKVRIVRRGVLDPTPCAVLDVEHENERGALGIALHPRFRDNHYLYVYYTNASPLENRVTRFTVRDGACVEPVHVVTGLPSPDTRHNGGQIEIAGGHLFVATGDGTAPSRSQNLGDPLGKVLRYELDGSIPEDNPFSAPGSPSPVWSYGHRNPFGLARVPGTGELFESENGPDCDDELNRIEPGRNYGWGLGYTCGTNGVGASPHPPLLRWTPPIVPTDLWWYDGRMRRLAGDLYMGDFGPGGVRRFTLDDTRTSVKRARVIHDDEPVVDVSEGPGGWLYFMTLGEIKRIVRAS